jgi:glycerol kinase
VVAVGVANQGETVVAWDAATGRPLGNAISWQDRRAVEVTDRLSGAADRLHEITGLTLDPYFTAPKLAWLEGRSDRHARVTGIDAWINFRLTGRTMTDVTTASRSLLLDLDSRTWSDEAAALFGLELASLPEIVDCAATCGETSLFGPALPLTGLCVDQQAALIGEHCLEPGEAKCTYGTGAFLLITTGTEAKRSLNGLSSSVAWQYGEHHSYCLDGQLYSAGSAVQWLERIGIIRDADDLDQLSSTARRGSSVLCIPSFAGFGAPYWQPQAKAHFEGIDLGTGRAEIAFSVLDGIACQVAVLVRAAETDIGRPLSVLRVDGGLTRSSVLMQLQADLLQVPVELFTSPHATVLGVAALARYGAGVADSIATTPVSGARTFEPRISLDEAAYRLEHWELAAQRVITAANGVFPR